MWLFTKYGFFSVVTSDRTSKTFAVRARVRSDLEALIRATGLQSHDTTGTPTILETPERDYSFRVLVTKREWEFIAHQLAESIDYPNFKGAIFRVQGAKREGIYHKVWSLLQQALGAG